MVPTPRFTSSYNSMMPIQMGLFSFERTYAPQSGLGLIFESLEGQVWAWLSHVTPAQTQTTTTGHMPWQYCTYYVMFQGNSCPTIIFLSNNYCYFSKSDHHKSYALATHPLQEVLLKQSTNFFGEKELSLYFSLFLMKLVLKVKFSNIFQTKHNV